MDKEKEELQFEKILALVRAFCADKLDADYAQLAERLAHKLHRKRAKPLATGQPQIWAAAIIHALGTLNFLFDKSFAPYVSAPDLNAYFGTSPGTVSSKSKLIRDTFKMSRLGGEFSTQRMQESNPFANVVLVDGVPMPLSALPEALQQAVKQARAAGQELSFSTRRP